MIFFIFFIAFFSDDADFLSVVSVNFFSVEVLVTYDSFFFNLMMGSVLRDMIW